MISTKVPNKTLDPTGESVSILMSPDFIMFLSILSLAVPAVGQLGR